MATGDYPLSHQRVLASKDVKKGPRAFAEKRPVSLIGRFQKRGLIFL
jgi:hypothetical protein